MSAYQPEINYWGKKDYSAVLIVFSLALVPRLYLLFSVPHVVFLHEADAMGYFAISKSILTSLGLGSSSTHFPPFYPLLVAIFTKFTDDMELAGRLVSCVMSAALVVPFYGIARLLGERRTALLSAIAAMLFHGFMEPALVPLSQATYLTMLAVSIWLAMIVVQSWSIPVSAMLGAASASTYLTRPEGILVYAALAAVLLSSLIWRDGTVQRRSCLKAIAVSLVVFLLVAFPYVVYLHNWTGSWTISGKSGVTIIGVDASMKLLSDGTTVGEKFAGKTGMGSLFPGIRQFFATYFGNLSKFIPLIPLNFPLPLLAVAIVGGYSVLREATRLNVEQRSLRIRQLLVLLSLVAVNLPVFAFSNLSVGISYILPLFMLLLILFCFGVSFIEDLLLKLLNSSTGFVRLTAVRGILSIAAVSLIGVITLKPVWERNTCEDFRLYSESQYFFLKETGLWIGRNTPDNTKLMTRWSNIPFYAGRPWAPLVDGSIPEVIRYAKSKNVKLLVIDSNAVPYRRPQLEPLLDPSVPHEGLMPVYAQYRYGILVIIYQVV